MTLVHIFVLEIGPFSLQTWPKKFVQGCVNFHMGSRNLQGLTFRPPLTNRDGDVCGLLLLGVDERTHLERAVVAAAAAVARVVVVVCGRRDAALWREIQILLLLAPLGVSLLLLLLGPDSKENLFVGLTFWFEK